jgi:hypothetical protein
VHCRLLLQRLLVHQLVVNRLRPGSSSSSSSSTPKIKNMCCTSLRLCFPDAAGSVSSVFCLYTQTCCRLDN